MAGVAEADAYNTLDLQQIRDLFFERQYRQCIQACYAALNTTRRGARLTPVQVASITFYLALAHDELARSMHQFSQFKIPAFHQAAQSYRQALDTLPTTSQDILGPLDASGSNTGLDTSSYAARSDTSSAPSTATIRTALSWQTRTPSPAFSHNDPKPVITQTGHIQHGSSSSHSGLTPAFRSHIDQRKSRDSFSNIVTPNPVLTREYSSISLLETPIHNSSTLQTGPSHSLLRPIRPGSPPKVVQPYTTQPISRQNAITSALPKLTIVSPPRRPAQYVLPGDYSPTSPVSPVSPLEDTVWTSDCSDVSPITPSTPELPSALPFQESGSSLKTPRPQMQLSSSSPLITAHERQRYSIDENLSAMRAQLERHLGLVEQAKSSALEAQSAHSSSRSSRSQTTDHEPMPKKNITPVAGRFYSDKQPVHVQQTRSFWSFTPPDEKAAQLEQRIEEGRARNWERKRFDPSRYRALAEQALAEL